GLTDDINNPDRNFKFQAVRDLIGERAKEPDSEDGVPEHYQLLQNYPNPFNRGTFIKFGLPKAGHVSITLYNILGEKVDVLVDGWREAGFHTVVLKDPGLVSGVYFYQMKSAGFTKVKKGIQIR
ncbi:T9SS type A sorting domain-containing protein, partial [candidate division KSB1 bacterium]|nr:T9SS type A sorting domain-containing protein [candidate division KSB1 bacterium]